MRLTGGPGHRYDDCCSSYEPSRSSNNNDVDSSTPNRVQNLLLFRGGIEDLKIKADKVIFVLMHSHVTLAQCLSAISASHCSEVVGILTCPCCNYDAVQRSFQSRAADEEYVDWSMWSDKRLVRCWNSDDGSREGFYDLKKEKGDTWTTSIALDEAPALPVSTKSGMSALIEVGLAWCKVNGQGSASLELAMNRAQYFYSHVPKLYTAPGYGEGDANQIKVAHERWTFAGSNLPAFNETCRSLEPGSSNDKIVYIFRGRLDSSKTKLRRSGKNMVFMDLTIVEREDYDDPITRRFDSSQVELGGMKKKAVKKGKDGLEVSPSGVRTIQLLLQNLELRNAVEGSTGSALCSLLQQQPYITVKGHAGRSVAKNENGEEYNQLIVFSLEVEIPEPMEDVIRDRLRRRDEEWGCVVKESGGWYSKGGELR
jgi:hypothetical protein